MKAAAIFCFLLMVMAFTTSNGDVDIVRRQRDGNIMETGCDELDDFINHMAKFTKKIVAMFYDGSTEHEEDDLGKNEINDDDQIRSSRDLNNKKNDVKLGVQNLDKYKNGRTFDEMRKEGTGDLVHMDLLPID